MFRINLTVQILQYSNEIRSDVLLVHGEKAPCASACESVRNLVSLEVHASLDKSSICRNLLSILGIFCCRIFLLLLV